MASNDTLSELQDNANNELPDLPTDFDTEDQPMKLTNHLSKEHEQPDFSQDLISEQEQTHFTADVDSNDHEIKPDSAKNTEDQADESELLLPDENDPDISSES